jgi:hypothetical protein
MEIDSSTFKRMPGAATLCVIADGQRDDIVGSVHIPLEKEAE